MRLTLVLRKQNILRRAKEHWRVGRNVTIRNSNAVESVSALGIPVVDMNDVVKDMKIVKRVKVEEEEEVIQLAEPLPAFNESHPLYKVRECRVHNDRTVLIGGLDQAKVVAKGVQVKEGLPKALEDKICQLNVADMHKLVQRSILDSHVFDAQQVKLPRFYDPTRPAWKFPRPFGMTDKRCNYLLCEKLVQLCNSWSQKSSALFAVNNSKCVVPIEKDGVLMQFDLTLNMSLLSSIPHDKFSSLEEAEQIYKTDLPDIYPLTPSVSFPKTHFYEPNDIFPVSNESKFCNLHTIIIHHNKTQVKNLHGSIVQDSQLTGRCLLYSFAAAVSQARQLFKETEKELPFPISVQCIQTDGRIFDFCVFQLNTLDINGNEGLKNMFWMLPRMKLFTVCAYKNGRPTLEEYNPEVFKHFLTFCTH